MLREKKSKPLMIRKVISVHSMRGSRIYSALHLVSEVRTRLDLGEGEDTK